MNLMITKNMFYRLISYVVIGGFAAGIDLIIFLALTSLYIEADPYLANIVSIHIGIITSFLLNRRYNFKRKDKTAFRFISFYGIGLCGLLIASLVLFIGARHSIPLYLTKIGSIFFVTLFQFLMNYFVTFRR